MAYRLRIKFSKYAHMIYIGHLDLMRYFQKAIRRADLDICYSEGFSPHQIMSFAQPLGVGVCSNGEYMEISVRSLTTSSQLQEALQDSMAEGVDILSVRLLEDKTPNAMASIAAAAYTVSVREGHLPGFDFASAVNKWNEQSSVPIVKVTKKGERELDLKQHVYELELGDKDGKSLYMLLDASSGGNIKPSLVMEQLCAMTGVDTGENDLLVTREDMFTLAPEDSDERFLSLGEIGSIY